MDLISSGQFHGYENILDQINREHEKTEKLKLQLKKENDRIIALKFSLRQVKEKITSASVKIFNDLSEVNELYCNELRYCDLPSLAKNENCKFYLVEIIVTKSLLEKFLPMEWQLNINVSSKTNCINSVIPLRNKPSIYEVIPVPSDIKECVVNIFLSQNINGIWNVIDLNSINVDISYHFQTLKHRKNRHQNLDEKLQSISKLYPKASSNLMNYLEMELICNFSSSKDFVTNFVKNSYHKLDLEIISEFCNDDKLLVDFHFYLFDKKVTVFYNKSSKLLKINCPMENAVLVKKFFVQFSPINVEGVKSKLKELNRERRALGDSEDILPFYKKARKLWL